MANGDELAYEVIQGASNRWRAVRDGILGHMAEAAATGAVGTTKTQMAYIKQIVNLLNPSGTFDLDQIAQSLYGGSGISTFPTAAQAANGVNLARVIRYIQEALDDDIPKLEGTRFSTMRVMAGNTVPQDAQTLALTLPVTINPVLLEGVIISTDATGWNNAGGQDVEFSFDNAIYGSGAVANVVESIGEASLGVRLTASVTDINSVLDVGGVMYIHKNAADALLAGNGVVRSFWRRLGDGANALAAGGV